LFSANIQVNPINKQKTGKTSTLLYTKHRNFVKVHYSSGIGIFV